MKSINWSVNVDETEFQELFDLYWNTLEGSKERESVVNEFNKYVYFYITNRYMAEFDLASDFCMEIMTQMKKIIEEYEPSYHIAFLPYLKSKIKRRFLNFKLKNQKKKSYENLNEFYEINPDLDVKSVFESGKSYNKENSADLIENIHACLSMLKTDEEVSIKLYFCFPLFYKDFRFLARNLSRKAVFIKYREYLHYMHEKIQSEKEARGNIVRKLYYTNIKIREEYKNSLLKKRKRLIAALYDIKNPVPLRFIADIMQTNVTNIHRKIKRARVKLENQLSKQLYLDFKEPLHKASKEYFKKVA